MKNLPARLPPWSAKAVNDVGRVCCNADSVSGTAWITVRGAAGTCEIGVTKACVRARTSARAVVRSMVAVAVLRSVFASSKVDALAIIAARSNRLQRARVDGVQ